MVIVIQSHRLLSSSENVEDFRLFGRIAVGERTPFLEGLVGWARGAWSSLEY